MKRALAIPLGLSLFGLAVASFAISRPANKVPAASMPVAAATSSTVEVAQADDYLPPLLGIFDDQDLVVPTALEEVAGAGFERPNLLPAEILSQAAWPAAQASDLLTVGFDNPLPIPMNSTPKIVLPGSSSLLIPEQLDTQSTSGYQPTSPAAAVTPRLSDNMIRPKPLAMDIPLARIQPTEPPLAGSQNIPAPANANPALPVPASIQATPVQPVPATTPIQATPAQSILARNLSDYTGCACEPRVGTGCGHRSRFFGGREGCCANETPLCCQSFANCCQSSSGCQVVEISNCCSEEKKWHPFAKLRGWFRSKRGCDCCEESCFECDSGRKPLFNRIRGIFHKGWRDDCTFVEPFGCGTVRTGCCGQ